MGGFVGFWFFFSKWIFQNSPLVVPCTDVAGRDKAGFWPMSSSTVDGAVQFSAELQDSSSRIKAPFQFKDTNT